MKIKKYQFALCLVIAFALGGASFWGGLTCKYGKDLFTNASKISEIHNMIDKNYLEEYEDDNLREGMYKGYVSGLGDKYSAYMSKVEYENYQNESAADYSGVGITFAQDSNGNFVAISIREGSPADKAGIKAGDNILSVDGIEYEDEDKLATMIRGEEGTKVVIKFSRNDKTFKKTLVRKKIVNRSVDYRMLNEETGYIEISEFIENTYSDFKKALDNVEKKGAKYLVLDLRNNGGGLVTSAVDVGDEFLDSGVICYIEDKYGNRGELSGENGKTKLKTVVLVNENTASSSEILAGALKYKGFTVVGTNTFGKGIIQSTFKLSDGDVLKLTQLRTLTPNEHVIHKKGIKPTVKVEDNEKTEQDEQLDKALTLLN